MVVVASPFLLVPLIPETLICVEMWMCPCSKKILLGRGPHPRKGGGLGDKILEFLLTYTSLKDIEQAGAELGQAHIKLEPELGIFHLIFVASN